MRFWIQENIRAIQQLMIDITHDLRENVERELNR